MRRIVALAVLVLVAAGILIFATARRPASVELGERREAPAAPEPEPLARTNELVEAEAGSAETADAARVALAADPAPAAPLAPVPATGARVHGSFVLPDGRPAAGVLVSLRGFAGSSDRVREHGQPADWVDPVTESDAQGRFELRFAPPAAFQFVMKAELDGHGAASWRWREIAPDEQKDVGQVELSLAGTLVARVVDAAGKRLVDGWSVRADPFVRDRAAGQDGTDVTAAVDPTSGFARLEGVPPGTSRIRASSRIAGGVEGPTVEVVGGEEIEVEIRYEGPDLSRRIQVATPTPTFHSVHVESVWLRGPGGERRSPGTFMDRHSFDDLEPGRYTVGIDDPRFEPWSQEGVAPGTAVRATLRCNAALVVEVVDAASGAPIEPYGLEVRLDRSESRPNVFTLRTAQQPTPDGGVYEGLPPMELSLLVAAEGYAELEHALGELLPNERRTVRLELRPAATLRGRVVEHDGTTPVGGAEVQLLAAGEGPRVTKTARPDPDVIGTTTDGDGRFELAALSEGARSLHAIANPWVVASVEPVEPVSGATPVAVELVLPAAGSLEATVLVPDGASVEGMRGILKPAAVATVRSPFPPSELALVLSSSPGRMVLGERLLPLGTAQILLRTPDVTLPMDFDGWQILAPKLELATVEIEAGRTTEVEIDLRERWPGALRVHVTREGAPLADHVVELCAAAGYVAATGAVTDASGVALVEQVLPGEWFVLVRPVARSWTFSAPAAVMVAAGRETALEVDVLLGTGSVQVVDAAGAPRAALDVWIVGEAGRGHRHVTDGEGRLSLELAPGSYALQHADGEMPPFSGPRATLEWSASGPIAPRVALPSD